MTRWRATAIGSPAWHKVKKSDLRTWLHDSAATLVDRWRATYAASGGR